MDSEYRPVAVDVATVGAEATTVVVPVRELVRYGALRTARRGAGTGMPLRRVLSDLVRDVLVAAVRRVLCATCVAMLRVVYVVSSPAWTAGDGPARDTDELTLSDVLATERECEAVVLGERVSLDMVVDAPSVVAELFGREDAWAVFAPHVAGELRRAFEADKWPHPTLAELHVVTASAACVSVNFARGATHSTTLARAGDDRRCSKAANVLRDAWARVFASGAPGVLALLCATDGVDALLAHAVDWGAEANAPSTVYRVRVAGSALRDAHVVWTSGAPPARVAYTEPRVYCALELLRRYMLPEVAPKKLWLWLRTLQPRMRADAPDFVLHTYVHFSLSPDELARGLRERREAGAATVHNAARAVWAHSMAEYRADIATLAQALLRDLGKSALPYASHVLPALRTVAARSRVNMSDAVARYTMTVADYDAYVRFVDERVRPLLTTALAALDDDMMLRMGLVDGSDYAERARDTARLRSDKAAAEAVLRRARDTLTQLEARRRDVLEAGSMNVSRGVLVSLGDQMDRVRKTVAQQRAYADEQESMLAALALQERWRGAMAFMRQSLETLASLQQVPQVFAAAHVRQTDSFACTQLADLLAGAPQGVVVGLLFAAILDKMEPGVTLDDAISSALPSRQYLMSAEEKARWYAATRRLCLQAAVGNVMPELQFMQHGPGNAIRSVCDADYVAGGAVSGALLEDIRDAHERTRAVVQDQAAQLRALGAAFA